MPATAAPGSGSPGPCRASASGPFVYRRAVELGLSGFVLNDSDGVLIEVEGDGARIDALARALRDDAPPLARVERSSSPRPCAARADGAGFTIEHSDGPRRAGRAGERRHGAVRGVPRRGRRSRRPPATATRSPTAPTAGPGTRSCWPCPYDRPATTMAGFAMCAGLPGGVRRPGRPALPRPAQRLPGVRPAASRGATRRARSARRATTPSTAAVAALLRRRGRRRQGRRRLPPGRRRRRRAEAVAELRRRKARDDKPFAVMVADLDAARALCRPRRARRRGRSSSPRRPIVLAPRRAGCGGRRRRRARPARARADAALQPAPPPAARRASGGRS